VPLPGVQPRQGLGAFDQGLHLGVRLLRQADLGDRRYGDARLEAADDGLVLGGLPDGHPFQRHLGAATAGAARPGLVQDRLAALRQAPPGDAAPDRNPLAGLVEVDETTIPYRTRQDSVAGGGGRSGEAKMRIAGAVEVEGNGPGRVRLAAIEDFSAKSLHAFLEAHLAPGATARTDGWPGYPGAPGIVHDPHVVGPMAAHLVLPWAHRLFANLKRWALGVYHGLRRKHLQSYLDEFAFRFNRRRTRHAAFRSLLTIAVAIKPTTYKMLIQPEATA